MAATAKVRIKSRLGKAEVPREVRVQFEMMRAEMETYRRENGVEFSSDQFIDPELKAGLEDALDEIVVAGLKYDSCRGALAILRESGRYNSHAEQSKQTAYAELVDSMYSARDDLLEAQGNLIGACQDIEIYLVKKCRDSQLDTMRTRSFTNEVVTALEQSWGHLIPEGEVWSHADRVEIVAKAAIALSVLRTIAKAEKAEDTPERRASRARAQAGMEDEKASHSARMDKLRDWIGDDRRTRKVEAR